MFAWSLMPHQLMLLFHSLCALRTALTTLSRSIPFTVAPIHHFLVSASRNLADRRLRGAVALHVRRGRPRRRVRDVGRC